MSSRRELLIGRFRASSVDRIRKVSLALIEVQQGRSTSELLEGVLRELHTLKGESRMLGFAGIADVAHAMKSVLSSHPVDAPSAESCGQVLHALEVVTSALRAELGDEAETRSALNAGESCRCFARANSCAFRAGADTPDRSARTVPQSCRAAPTSRAVVQVRMRVASTNSAKESGIRDAVQRTPGTAAPISAG